MQQTARGISTRCFIEEVSCLDQCFFFATTTAAPASANMPSDIAMPPKPVSGLSVLPLSEPLFEFSASELSEEDELFASLSVEDEVVGSLELLGV